jgi:hypothetical protein
MQDAQLEAEVVPPDCGGAVRLNAVQRPQVADVPRASGSCPCDEFQPAEVLRIAEIDTTDQGVTAMTSTLIVSVNRFADTSASPQSRRAETVKVAVLANLGLDISYRVSGTGSVNVE